jgi:hypothetical protein
MIVQPSNVSGKQPMGANANGTSSWQGGSLLPYTPNVARETAQPLFYMTAYPLQFMLISGKSGITTGQADPYYEMNVLGRNLHAVAVSASGTYNATVLFEATLDGVNWFTLQSVTAAGIYQFSGVYQSIRVSITAWTSGAITVTGITQRT